MSSEILNWILSGILSSALLGSVGYLLRDAIGSYFAKAAEHRFEKKLESFKASIRDNEKELDQIRSFLVGARRDRDSAIQSKRLEAAETLLRTRNILSQLTMLVEYIKILNIDELIKEENDQKISKFIGDLIDPFNVDEKISIIGAADKTIPQLYLSERSLKLYYVYESIIIQASVVMKLLAMPLHDKGSLMKARGLSKAIIELFPNSKSGFEKFGEEYAYHWSQYFHDEVLRSLRHEVSGIDDMNRDADSIERLALDSRRAQINIRSSLEQMGLSDSLINANVEAAESAAAAENRSQ
ncbi:hypothetical protein [Hoeflea sp.]|uniref:hypothetical protein n=1 Tax=Hoeflea sp. TaxID=1940281 RepID=UPI003A911A57